MQEIILSLQDQVDKITEEKIKTESKLSTVRLKLDYVLEQFKLSKQRQFGRSSEKELVQYNIFDEAGITLPDEAKENAVDEKEVITYERKRNAGKAKRTAPHYQIIFHEKLKPTISLMQKKHAHAAVV